MSAQPTPLLRTVEHGSQGHLGLGHGIVQPILGGLLALPRPIGRHAQAIASHGCRLPVGLLPRTIEQRGQHQGDICYATAQLNSSMRLMLFTASRATASSTSTRGSSSRRAR